MSRTKRNQAPAPGGAGELIAHSAEALEFLLVQGAQQPSPSVAGDAERHGASYALALGRAYHERKFAELFRLLNNETPIQPELLPAFAMVVASLLQPNSGRPRRMTPFNTKVAFLMFNAMVDSGASNRTDAIATLANDFGVDEQTIKRALKEAPALLEAHGKAMKARKTKPGKF